MSGRIHIPGSSSQREHRQAVLAPLADETYGPKTNPKPLVPPMSNPPPVSDKRKARHRCQSYQGLVNSVSRENHPLARALRSDPQSFTFMVSVNRQNGLPHPLWDEALPAQPLTHEVGVGDTHACAAGSSGINDDVASSLQCTYPPYTFLARPTPKSSHHQRHLVYSVPCREHIR